MMAFERAPGEEYRVADLELGLQLGEMPRFMYEECEYCFHKVGDKDALMGGNMMVYKRENRDATPEEREIFGEHKKRVHIQYLRPINNKNSDNNNIEGYKSESTRSIIEEAFKIYGRNRSVIDNVNYINIYLFRFDWAV